MHATKAATCFPVSASGGLLTLLSFALSLSLQAQNPTLISTFTWPLQQARTVAIQGGYAYVTTTNNLEVLDISDPAIPRRIGGCPANARGTGVAVSGHYVYTLVLEKELQIFDVSSPANPVRVGSCPVNSYSGDVAVSGDYAYVAEGTYGLSVIDVHIPSNPLRLGVFDTSGNALGVAIASNYAYVADELSGLSIIDVSNPTNLVRVGGFDTPGIAADVTVLDNYAYVADFTNGLEIIDVSNPASPVRAGRHDTPGTARSVTVLGDYAFIADSNPGLQVIYINDAAKPVRVGGYATSTSALSVAGAGNNAYLATASSGLLVFDVFTPYHQPPQIIQQPFNRTNIPGTSVSFSVSASGTPPLFYQWRMDGVNLVEGERFSGVNQPTLTLSNLQTSDVGFYSVVVSNVAGQAISADAALSVPGAVSLQIITQPQNQTGLAGGQVSFTVTAIGQLPLNYQWRKDGTNLANGSRIAGANTSTLAISYLQNADAGNYSVIITDLSGQMISSNALLQVAPVDNPILSCDFWAGGNVDDVVLSGHLAFLASESSGLQILDVSNPFDLVQVGVYDSAGTAYSVAVAGNYAYLADGENGLQVINVSNPANPVRVGGYDTIGTASDVAVVGSYAYVADRSSGLQVIDVSTPDNPVRVGGYACGGQALEVAVSGSYAYVADTGLNSG